jgi:hypothetical protein
VVFAFCSLSLSLSLPPSLCMHSLPGSGLNWKAEMKH